MVPRINLLVGALLVLLGQIIQGQPLITIDPATRFQTIAGWEAVTFASQTDPTFPKFKDELFERVITEAGIDRVRLEVRSGAENSTNYFAAYQNGIIDYATWRANRYATVNDNADTNELNAGGFHFTELDQNIRSTVIPLREIATAKGQRLNVNLNYVAFTSQITQGGAYHHDNAGEYAEFILAVFQHMDQEFGFVPDAVEILLEPDNVSQWNGTLLGQAIVAARSRLAAAGYSPEIIAPSCTNMGNAVSYFDQLAAVPGALSALTEICYHRYGGVSDANLQALASRAVQHGKRTSMLEWWSTGNGIDVLLKDLTIGRNSAWHQGVLAGIGGLDDDMALYKVDTNNISAPVIRVNRKTGLLRQVYRFVRRGAVRIAVTNTTSALQPVAFINPDGGHVVVVRTTSAASFSISGLPAGTYGINYSTGAEFNVNRPDQTISSGTNVNTSIPAGGALTVYQLRPGLGAIISDDGQMQLSVQSLKPNFSGSVETIADLKGDAIWREVASLGPGQFMLLYSQPLAAGQFAFFRFRQN